MGFIRVPVSMRDTSNIIEPFLQAPLLCFAVLSCVIYFVTSRAKQFRGFRALTTFLRNLSGLTTVWLVIWMVCVEIYFYNLCPLDQGRIGSTKEIFKSHIDFLNDFVSEGTCCPKSSVPCEEMDYAVVEGTLLAVIRDMEDIMPWDQDSDTYLVLPKGMKLNDEFYDCLERELKRFHHNEDWNVQSYKERRVIQTQDVVNHGHGDIWLMEYEGDGDSLLAPDFTFATLPVPYRFQARFFVPSKTLTWSHYGSLRVPNDIDSYLTYQYGESYMKPYRSRMQCLENMMSKWPPNGLGGFLVVGVFGIAASVIAGRLGMTRWDLSRVMSDNDSDGYKKVSGIRGGGITLLPTSVLTSTLNKGD